MLRWTRVLLAVQLGVALVALAATALPLLGAVGLQVPWQLPLLPGAAAAVAGGLLTVVGRATPAVWWSVVGLSGLLVAAYAATSAGAATASFGWFAYTSGDDVRWLRFMLAAQTAGRALTLLAVVIGAVNAVRLCLPGGRAAFRALASA
ncbi:hypothetical protein DEF23_15925 [Marinitenerispora sediminis]|uniref:Uncharacterized protein n=1 Tax=Marinitenerispora sediminis TaxID=1931232 RepID=A0A368T945_9ACTN|nr:hypothetical protein DEF23_15925 [Marinitenerispora sediminis]RCV55341.1 hypothetical protein DEF28_06030 [Marinitenerispora sediminis]RCV60945.1 hypothetical protein DEF24_05330 [Marinitenerispora sediminis]